MTSSTRLIKTVLWLLFFATVLTVAMVFRFGAVAKFDQLINANRSSSSNTVLSGAGVVLDSEDVLIVFLVVGSLIGLAVIGWIMSAQSKGKSVSSWY